MIRRSVAVAALLLLVIASVVGLDYWLEHRPSTPVAVEVVDSFPLVGSRTIVLGMDHFTVAGVRIRRLGETAFVNGLVRNDTLEPQASVQVRVIGHDANGKEAWSGADTALGGELAPGAVKPFVIRVDDGSQVPDDTSGLEFEARAGTTGYQPGSELLEVTGVAVERRGNLYAVTGTLRSGAREVRYPTVQAILFDADGAVLSAGTGSPPEVTEIAPNSELPFVVKLDRLAEAPTRVYVAGEGLPLIR